MAIIDDLKIYAQVLLPGLIPEIDPYSMDPFEHRLNAAMKIGLNKAVHLRTFSSRQIYLKCLRLADRLDDIFSINPADSHYIANILLLTQGLATPAEKLTAARHIVNRAKEYENHEWKTRVLRNNPQSKITFASRTMNRMFDVLRTPDLGDPSVQTKAFDLWQDRYPKIQSNANIRSHHESQLEELRDIYKDAQEKPPFYPSVLKMLEENQGISRQDCFARPSSSSNALTA